MAMLDLNSNLSVFVAVRIIGVSDSLDKRTNYVALHGLGRILVKGAASVIDSSRLRFHRANPLQTNFDACWQQRQGTLRGPCGQLRVRQPAAYQADCARRLYRYPVNTGALQPSATSQSELFGQHTTR